MGSTESSSPTPSNNSSIAPPLTLDAMVVLWTTLSNTSRLPHSNMRMTTPTMPEDTDAPTSNPRHTVLSKVTTMLPKDPKPNLRLPSPKDQSPLPSKPIKWPSKDTPVVSSPQDVDPNSTTVSSLSDTEPRTDKTSSSSRTPGEQAGESTDTSRLHQPNAVSPMCLS